MVHHEDIPTFAPGVLNAIRAHVDSDPNNEVGGVLVSRMVTGRRAVVAHIEAHAASGDVTSLTFTHEAWSEIHTAMEREHAGAEIGGWYHSHPGHGIFLSGQDRFVHHNFFSAPWHVALVIDPQHHTEGLFALRDGDLVQVYGDEDPIPETPRRVLEVLVEQTGETSVVDSSPSQPHEGMPRLYGLILPAAVGLIVGVLAVSLKLI